MILKKIRKVGKIYEYLKCDYLTSKKCNYKKYLSTQNIIMI